MNNTKKNSIQVLNDAIAAAAIKNSEENKTDFNGFKKVLKHDVNTFSEVAL